MRRDILRKELPLHNYPLITGLVLLGVTCLMPVDEDKLPDIVETREVATIHYLTDSELSRLYTCKADVRNDTCLELTVDECDMLMRIAVVEDYTNAESQAWVMQTILNRVNDPDFPNTIQEVIEQKIGDADYAFSTVKNGDYQRAKPNVDSHLALYLVETRQIDTNALYFEADWATDTWQSNHRKLIGTVGHTRFYE